MKTSFKLWGIAAVAGAIVLAFVPVVAANGQAEPYIELYQQQTENVYKADQDVSITEDVVGDVVAAGSNIHISANVNGNVLVAGGTVQIDGNVGGDIAAAGGYVVVNGDVSGDIRVFGGQVFVNSKQVTGDLVVSAGKTELAKGLSIGGIEMIPNSDSLRRDVENPTKDVSQYRVMVGNYRDNERKTDKKLLGKVTVGALIFNTIMLVGTIISAYLILRLFPVISENALVTMQKMPFQSVVAGAATYVLGFILAIALAISIIGWHLLYVLAVLGLVTVMLSNVLATYGVGRLILKRFNRKNTGRLQPIVVGMLTVTIGFFVLSLVPVVGEFFVFVLGAGLSCWAVGSLMMNKWNAVMGEKKK